MGWTETMDRSSSDSDAHNITELYIRTLTQSSENEQELSNVCSATPIKSHNLARLHLEKNL